MPLPRLLRLPSSILAAASVLAAATPPSTATGPQAASELQGWTARWSVGESGAEETAALARVPAAAFVLGAGEVAHPGLPPGAATSTFEAVLRFDAPGDYRFGLEAAGGRARLELFDEDGTLAASVEGASEEPALSAWTARPRGVARVVVTFRREGSGPARLRSLWELRNTPSGGFPLEPIPSRAARVPARLAAAVEEEELALRGRVLLEQLGCTACHAPSEAQRAAVGVRQGPRLDAAGERFSLEWMRAWILDPARHRPGAAMPALLGLAATGEQAADPEAEAQLLARFLAGLGDPATREPGAWVAATEAPVLARGRELFHGVGCVACHGALEAPAGPGHEAEADAPSAPGRVPLEALAGKWRPAALAAFLREPLALRPDGRMPALGLTEEESDALACYLVARFGAGAPEAPAAPAPGGDAPEAAPPAGSPASLHAAAPPPGPAAEELDRAGRELFARRGCAACHALEGVEPGTRAAPLAALDLGRGCMDPADRATPRYALGAEERRALAAGWRSVVAASGAPAPLDTARRELATLDCRACHELDGEGGVPAALDVHFASTGDEVDLGDEGRLPPELSGVGTKLTTSWLARVLEEGARARPYLQARMPSFGARARPLAEALARAEGVRPDTDAREPAVTDELVLLGRDLLSHGNLGCMACHVYRDYPPTGTVGPDVTLFAERLRYEWYRTYMQNPQRYKPGSRMPDFATGGLSSLRDVLDGDMARQADAMWAYFGLGEGMPPPEGVAPGRGLPLAVGERPVVMRAFLEEVGARGIALGLPVGVHFGFDAERCRLVHAWQGSFVDASGSWAGRGGNELGGQGPIVWRAPEGPALVLGDLASGEGDGSGATPPGPRFRGYRLEADGHPVFLYEWAAGPTEAADAPVRVRERCHARVAPELVLLRSFEVEGLAPGAGLRLHGGPGTSVARAEGCSVTPAAGEDGWLDVRPDPGAARLSLEVEVRP